MEAKCEASSLVVSVRRSDGIWSSWTRLVGESSQTHGRVEEAIDLDVFCCSHLSSGSSSPIYVKPNHKLLPKDVCLVQLPFTLPSVQMHQAVAIVL